MTTAGFYFDRTLYVMLSKVKEVKFIIEKDSTLIIQLLYIFKGDVLTVNGLMVTGTH